MESSFFKGIKHLLESITHKDEKNNKQSVEEEDTKSSSNRYSASPLSAILTPHFSNSKIQESFTDSFFGSISEGTDSMMAQKVPQLVKTPATQIPTMLDQTLNNALREAAMQNKPKLCKELLDTEIYRDYVADINSKDNNGYAALHIAAYEGYLSVCEILLDYGMDVDLNIRNNRQLTPLHLACIRGHIDLAQLLVRSGADLNLTDNDGNSALHLAACNHHLRLLS